MQNNNIVDSMRTRLAVLGLLAGIGLFAVTAGHPATDRSGTATTGSGTVSSRVAPSGGVFGWD